MSDFETLTLSADAGVLTITLARPDRLNAVTPQTAQELRAALEGPAAAADVRVVVLTGEGRAFSSGADLKDDTAPKLPEGLPDFTTALKEFYNWPVRCIRRLPKPVIAAVNGPAVGVASSYALASDFVVTQPDAYFLLSFASIGLIPDGGSSALISYRAGGAKFSEMALLADRVGGEQAFAWGLADRLADDALAAANELATRLAAGPTRAYGEIKKLVNEGPLAGLEAALEREADLQGPRAKDGEFIEGVTAFLTKRVPNFAEVA